MRFADRLHGRARSWIILSLAAFVLVPGAVLSRIRRHHASGMPPKQILRPHVLAQNAIDAGRYLVVVGGCNDCHQPDWLRRAGHVPESQWLIGSAVGFRGPWGTTYPTNLRLYVQHMPEEQWVELVHTQPMKPPMPYWSLRALSDHDARAIYRFIKHLGPKGRPVPFDLPPGVVPRTNYYSMDLMWPPNPFLNPPPLTPSPAPTPPATPHP